MAVVQISKIQIRRGLKNSSSGVPQLSSAELAWAVDSQELFIGNGSVAEGAPYVGNTKILTENDNIIELASSYSFASDDPSITLSVPRSLGNKLDEIEVSVADFGAVGDGSTDNVAAFETAFEQLFRNADTDYRKVLKIPNGDYLFLSDLEIPSDVIIRGETQTGTVLNIDTNNILFVTSDGTGVASFNSTNRPKNIDISNLTITRSTGQTVLTGIADSEFTKVKFLGEYQLGAEYLQVPTLTIQSILSNVITMSSDHSLEIGDVIIPNATENGLTASTKYYVISVPASNTIVVSALPGGSTVSLVDGGNDPGGSDPLLSIVCNIESDEVSPLNPEPSAVFWQNNLTGIKVDNIKFKECTFDSNSISIKCSQSVQIETAIEIENCKFIENDTCIFISGVSGQINNWNIVDCEFEEIAKQALRSTNGYGTKIQRSKFKNCGNDTNDASSPVHEIVYFGESQDNIVVDCTSNRQQSAGFVTGSTTTSVAEVINSSNVSFVDKNYAEIFASDSPRPISIFSSDNNRIELEYVLKLNDYTRYGTVTMTIDENASVVSLVDNYNYSASSASSAGGPLMTAFEFSATLENNDNNPGAETVVLYYRNPQPTPSQPLTPTGTISFSVSYSV